MRRLTAWGLFSLSVVCWAFLLWGQLSGRWTLGSIVDGLYIIGVGASALGLLITLRRPHNRLGWLLAGAGLCAALGQVIDDAGAFLGLDRLESLQRLLADAMWLGVVGGLLVVFPLWFPDGRPPTSRWHWVLPSFAGVSLLFFVLPLLPHSYVLEAVTGSLWVAVGPLAAVTSLFHRYRHSNPTSVIRSGGWRSRVCCSWRA